MSGCLANREHRLQVFNQLVVFVKGHHVARVDVKCGGDRGYDGQEECGCSKEYQAGEGVVAVALAVGAHPYYDYSQDGVDE